MPARWNPSKALLSVVLLQVGAPFAGELTIRARIEAQRAIERVYYSHQNGATLPFDQAVPEQLLDKKVRLYLKQSAALEKLWKAPITAEALRREMERIAQDTRMPERLRELYAARGNDPVLIQECLVRPVLADRLARSYFSRDRRIHAEARRDAEDLHGRIASGVWGGGGLVTGGRYDPVTDTWRATTTVNWPFSATGPAV